jgi:hypothetical protein
MLDPNLNWLESSDHDQLTRRRHALKACDLTREHLNEVPALSPGKDWNHPPCEAKEPKRLRDYFLAILSRLKCRAKLRGWVAVKNVT